MFVSPDFDAALIEQNIVLIQLNVCSGTLQLVGSKCGLQRNTVAMINLRRRFERDDVSIANRRLTADNHRIHRNLLPGKAANRLLHVCPRMIATVGQHDDS